WPDIYLPGTDQVYPKTYSYEEASTFVSFSICTIADLEVGDCIENEAKITFDDQSPYITEPAIVCTPEQCDAAVPCWGEWEKHYNPKQAASKFQIYPNPFDDRINLQWPHQIDGNCRVNLMDFSGKKVCQLYEGEVAHLPKIFDLSKVDKGIYLIRITTTSEILTKKIVKH
ncbi:MAG: T9SS type A sorting domain-containing protein, partial [Bacteroidota bacterium]